MKGKSWQLQMGLNFLLTGIDYSCEAAVRGKKSAAAEIKIQPDLHLRSTP